MLRKLVEIRGLVVIAQEREVGTISDFLFDDQIKAVRYFVVRTGSWMGESKILTTPISISEINWLDGEVYLSLAREQVYSGPKIDLTLPLSRNVERQFLDHYGYSYYWSGPHLWGIADLAAELAGLKALTMPSATRQPDTDDAHTLSASEITGYHLLAADGEIGRIEDLIIEDESWAIRYLLVNTCNWLPGRSLVISPQWIERINWAASTVHLMLTQEAVRSCPEYDESTLVTREYERRLFWHYGQTGYWEQRNNGSNNSNR